MRIAQLAPPQLPVPPRRYGGTELVVSLLTEELVRRGHEVTLFASGDSITQARLEPTAERALWSDPLGVSEDAHVLLAKAIDQVYRQAGEFDVIHNHLGPLAFPVARLAGDLRTLSTLHGRLDLRGHLAVLRYFAGMPLVSISDSQRVPLPSLNWLATVHHGVDVAALTYHPAHEEYVAFLGRIAPEKGLDTAIRVAVQAGVPVKIGARPPLADPWNPEAQRDACYYDQCVAPLLHSPNVEYVGEIGPAGKNAFLGNAMALLFPIRWPEPFGLVMIEALACGTPVVALNHGSVSEIIEHGVTGFVVDREEDLAPALERVGELDRAKCRQAACERFSVARMADDYEAVYVTLLS